MKEKELLRETDSKTEKIKHVYVSYASQENISQVIAQEHNVELAEITVTPGKPVRVTILPHHIHKS